MEAHIEKVKLTKKALNDFIGWSSSRYNDYLGYGTKREAVLSAYHSIKNGYSTRVWFKRKNNTEIAIHETPEETTILLQCASPVGENGSNRSWGTNQGGDNYTVDCIAKSITAKYSKRVIYFQ